MPVHTGAQEINSPLAKSGAPNKKGDNALTQHRSAIARIPDVGRQPSIKQHAHPSMLKIHCLNTKMN